MKKSLSSGPDRQPVPDHAKSDRISVAVSSQPPKPRSDRYATSALDATMATPVRLAGRGRCDNECIFNHQ